MSMNAIHTYGIVTNDFELAIDTFNQIMDSRNDIVGGCPSYNNAYIRFEDGTKWYWIRPIDMSRGYRLHKALFDRRLTFEEFEFIWGQCCSGYCESYEWI